MRKYLCNYETQVGASKFRVGAPKFWVGAPKFWVGTPKFGVGALKFGIGLFFHTHFCRYLWYLSTQSNNTKCKFIKIQG